MPAVDEALGRAVISRLNLAGLLVAHGIPVEQLSFLLKLPRAAEHAVAEHVSAVETVTRLLAAEHGEQARAVLALEEKCAGNRCYQHQIRRRR